MYRVIVFVVNHVLDITEEIGGIQIKYTNNRYYIIRLRYTPYTFFLTLTDTTSHFSTFIRLSVFKELQFLVFPNNLLL